MILDPDLVLSEALPVWVSEILNRNGKVARAQVMVSMIRIFGPKNDEFLKHIFFKLDGEHHQLAQVC